MSKPPTCVVQDGCIARVHCRDLGYCKEDTHEAAGPFIEFDDEFDDARLAAPEGADKIGAYNILTEAANIVAGARNATHGEKERSFQVIADLWNAYLSGRKNQGPITPFDVAQFMVLLKIGRSIQGKPVRDHFVDAAGYSGIAGELSA